MRSVVAMILCFCCLNAGAQSWVPATGSFSFTITKMVEDTLQNLMYVCGHFGYYEDEHVGGFVSFDGEVVQGYGCGFDCDEPITEMISGPADMNLYHDTLYISGPWDESYDTLLNNIPLTHGFAKFFGGQWFPISEESSSNTIYAIQEVDDTLYVAGSSGNPIVGIEGFGGVRYNGINWTTWLIPGDFDNFINGIAKYQNQLYVAGNISGSGCLGDIQKWNGSNWECLGTGIMGSNGFSSVSDLLIYQNDLYVCGTFNRNAGNPGEGIMKWNGSEWSDVGYGLTNGEVHDMEVHNSELYVCGHFDEIGNIPADNFAKWDGHRWCALDAHFGNNYNRKLAFYNDTLYVVATTDSCANCLFKWNATVDTCSVDFNAVNEFQTSSKFSLYPNPIRESVTFESDLRMLSIEIFDMTGRKINGVQGNSTKQVINAETLAKGCYYSLVRFENGAKSTRKFMKE